VLTVGRVGHKVTVFERADRIGGLLRYGIPEFKMEKRHVDRRIEQMKVEGVEFKTNANIGHNVPVEDLKKILTLLFCAAEPLKPAICRLQAGS